MTENTNQVHQTSLEPKNEEFFEKRDFKTILKDAGRQLVASFIILIIGFLVLNWSAYYQIAQSQWRSWFGSQQISPLTQLVENKPVVYNSTNLQTSNNPTIQKKQIPPLDMEIAPSDDRIIIPRINQNIPVVKISSDYLIKRDWDGLEKQMQEALKDGVVHYPGTSLPGQTGNVVITGHSSYFPWDPGRFKDVFALLHDVVQGDRIVIYFNQDKYLYEVNDIKIILPDDISVLKQTPDNRITLITCTPVGTNLKRLIVTAKLIAKNGQPVE
ncbi:class D sortase [Candidatus Peregrinibacteria bacterium]|nr:class D sortase [Candidatus Peregrinibacteria bacterium]